MRLLCPVAAATLALAACGSPDNAPAADKADGAANAQAPTADSPATAAQPALTARWTLQTSPEGIAIALLSETGPAAIRLFCPTGGKRLLVNVPAFREIGSEERLSFGGSGEAVALVVDTRGDRRRGGVTGEGPVPVGLAAVIAEPLSASYGAQTSGPHRAPPPAVARAFVESCGRAAPPQPVVPPRKAASASTATGGPCSVQDGKPLVVPALRAVGTEPFWGAKIEGRCVTYSTPEDQKGTRIWTRYRPSGGGGAWVGALGGKPFELRTRAAPACSDGMSDRNYPLAVELRVAGGTRRGCAAPS